MIAPRELARFDEFVETSSDRLVRTAYLLCGDRGHAEDIAQTALMRTARRWAVAKEQPEAYARKVVVNLVKDRWRHLNRRPAELPLEVDVVMPSSTAELDRDVLLRAALALPKGQRTILVLRFFEDLSVEDTAACLGVTAGTVKSQTSRALDSLRATLNPLQEHAHAD